MLSRSKEKKTLVFISCKSGFAAIMALCLPDRKYATLRAKHPQGVWSVGSASTLFFFCFEIHFRVSVISLVDQSGPVPKGFHSFLGPFHIPLTIESKLVRDEKG